MARRRFGLNQIQVKLAKVSLFAEQGCAYLLPYSTKRIPRDSAEKEAVMNIYRGLLFLQGHLLRPEDVIDTPPSDNAPAPASKPDCFSLLESLSFLGGRSMRADRAGDLDPPLELLLHACGTRAARH
jgi:hypothetical protein